MKDETNVLSIAYKTHSDIISLLKQENVGHGICNQLATQLLLEDSTNAEPKKKWEKFMSKVN